jgi:transcription elongation factor GreB
MSRAFVSEEDSQFSGEEVPEIKIPLPPGAPNYMTPRGAEVLRNELSRLSGTERPRLAARLAREVSGAEGAGRENLSRGRQELRKLERRIEYLGRMLARLEVVTPGGQDTARVAFGAAVTVEEPGREPRVYSIVGVDESEPEQGRISWISPLAKALTGARVGDKVCLRLPEEERELTVTDIRYPAAEEQERRSQ